MKGKGNFGLLSMTELYKFYEEKNSVSVSVSVFHFKIPLHTKNLLKIQYNKLNDKLQQGQK